MLRFTSDRKFPHGSDLVLVSFSSFDDFAKLTVVHLGGTLVSRIMDPVKSQKEADDASRSGIQAALDKLAA